MKSISVLIKPASSSCNLRCKYCFYDDISSNRTIKSNGIMDESIMTVCIKRIAEAIDEDGTANISFQGGEPTLAGFDFFKKFTQTFAIYKNIHVNYSIQTNGTLITQEWVDLFLKYNFLVGISLDGYEANNNLYRYDPFKKGVYFKIINNINMLKKAGIQVNILTVITNTLSKHPSALYNFYKKHHFEYIQLIPCLPPLDKSDEISIKLEQYKSFFICFYNIWEADFKKHKSIPFHVNLFDNLAYMLYGFTPYQCGLNGICSLQNIIESNGDVYPCDFYCLDNYKLGNIEHNSFDQISKAHNSLKFLSESDCKKNPCNNCKFLKICNGGCRRQNVCYLSETECTHRDILEHILPRIELLLKNNS